MCEEENNAYIDILNLEISFTAEWNGSLYISAGYCDIDLAEKDRVTLTNNVMIVKMTTGEKIIIRNTVGLNYLKFERCNN